MASRLENVKHAYRIVSSRYPLFDGAGAYRWGQPLGQSWPPSGACGGNLCACSPREPRALAEWHAAARPWYAFRSQSRAMLRRSWLMRSIRRCYSPTTTARREASATTGTSAEIPPYCGFHPSCLRTNQTCCAVNCTRTSHGLSSVSPLLLRSMPACRPERDAGWLGAGTGPLQGPLLDGWSRSGSCIRATKSPRTSRGSRTCRLPCSRSPQTGTSAPCPRQFPAIRSASSIRVRIRRGGPCCTRSPRRAAAAKGPSAWGGAFGTTTWTDPAQETTAVLMGAAWQRMRAPRLRARHP